MHTVYNMGYRTAVTGVGQEVINIYKIFGVGYMHSHKYGSRFNDTIPTCTLQPEASAFGTLLNGGIQIDQ